MPSLKCTYQEFIDILKAHGFELRRHDGTSHQQWTKTVGGVWHVTVAGHSLSADIPIGTLQSMIRQSGLNKKLFRK